jgi:hypothetical protein
MNDAEIRDQEHKFIDETIEKLNILVSHYIMYERGMSVKSRMVKAIIEILWSIYNMRQ